MVFLDRYIDGTYEADNQDWHEADAPWKAEHIREIISKNQIKPSTLCDVGCGPGAVLSEVRKRLPQAQLFRGFDISPQSIARAKMKETENLSFSQADFLTDTDETFDLIMLIDVFEHIPDYLGFLEKLNSRAKWHVFHIPLDLSALSVLRSDPIISKRERVGHIHYYTAQTALATLKDTGYKVKDWFYTASGFQPEDTSLKASIRDFPKKQSFNLWPDWSVRFFGGYSMMVLCENS